jgi:hypothetical protein
MQGDEPAGTTASAALERRVEARLDEQRRVVQELLQAGELLPGSVFERWSTCNKAGCSCAEGRRHGPYYVLATGSGPARTWVSLDDEGLAEARELVRRHREYRKGLERLVALHKALAELLKRHAEQSARKAAKRLRTPGRGRS